MIHSALLRAFSLDEQDIKGTLFIVNRGQHGMGYHRCSRCSYAEPAKKFGTVKSNHRNPLTGAKCTSLLEWPVDLAHTFQTDVRILKFNSPFPKPSGDETNTHNFQDSFYRTLSEAMRFAAAELLTVQSREIRSTYRINGQYIETILYDAVPGGAGYAVRIGTTDYPLRELIVKAIKLLECPNACSRSCRACLCDYSNQRLWDIFDRKPALEWLKTFLTDKPQVSIPWEKPTLKGLADRLLPYNQVHLVAEQLESANGENSDERDWLVKWLLDGKTAIIHLLKPLPKTLHKLSPRQRATYRYLHPYVQDNRLMIGLCNIETTISPQNLPRIFVLSDEGAPLWRTDYPVPALLEHLLPEPLYEAKARPACKCNTKYS